MKYTLSMLLLFPLTALLQLLLPPFSALGGMKPPLLLALLLHYALNAPERQVRFAVLWAVLFQDMLSCGGPGPGLLSFPLLAWGAYRLRFEIFADHPGTLALLGGCSAVLLTLAAALVYGLTGQRPVSFLLLAIRVPGSLLQGAVTLPLVSLLATRMEEFIARRWRTGW